VTWIQAQTYCRSIGKRLPSENEWEAAARTLGGRFPWGDLEPACGRAVYGEIAGGACDRGTGGEPGPAAIGPGGVEPEPETVLHLAGNVWEFVDSDYAPSRGAGSGERSQPGASTLRVVKGGAYSTSAHDLRSAARLGVLIDHQADDVGFRCALDDG
jgi:iron(II)-dependent oxidoreductase